MIRLLFILPLSMALCACPFESKVPLSSAPAEAVDTTLLGYWYGIVKDGSDFFGIEALDITRQSDSVYAITRYGKAVKGDIILPDTSYFTGYTSYIGDQRFMNLEGTVLIEDFRRNKKPVIKKEKVFYISALEKSHDTLSIKTITETFSPTVKVFANPDDFKRIVAESIRLQKNIYDDMFSLSYKKIPRPGKLF